MNFENQGSVLSGSAEIFFYECGSGEPLILLHGNSESKTCFLHQLPELSPRYRCIVIESRGHGRSTHGTEKLSLSLMADDVFKIMDHLKLEKAHVLGFSDGGNIALHMALKAPERLHSLILSGANADPSGLDPKGMFMIKLTQQLLRAGALFSSSLRAKLEIWELMIYEPNITEAGLKSISLPALITAGERDIILREHTEYLHRSIKNSRLEIIRGGDHHVNSRLPELYNRAVKDFLSSTESKTIYA